MARGIDTSEKRDFGRFCEKNPDVDVVTLGETWRRIRMEYIQKFCGPDTLLEKLIEDKYLSGRVRRLPELGIKTLGQVVEFDKPSDLLSFQGVGRKSVDELLDLIYWAGMWPWRKDGWPKHDRAAPASCAGFEREYVKCPKCGSDDVWFTEIRRMKFWHEKPFIVRVKETKTMTPGTYLSTLRYDKDGEVIDSMGNEDMMECGSCSHVWEAEAVDDVILDIHPAR